MIEQNITLGITRFESVWPRQLWGRRNYARPKIASLDQVEWLKLARALRARHNIWQPNFSQIEKQRRKRLVKKIVQELRRQPGRKRLPPLNKPVLACRRKSSVLLSAFLPNRDNSWKPILKRDRSPFDIALKEFSLIDSPISTIEMLQSIAHAEADKASVKINFDDQTCLDISPYLILGLMRPNMAPVVTGGSITPTVTGMIDAVGLGEFLSISNINRIHTSPTFIPFKVRYRRKAGTSTSQNTAFQPTKEEEIADALVETVDGWLQGMQTKGLTAEGKQYLVSIVTEPLDNAQRHSDITNEDGEWAIAGFLSAVDGISDEKPIRFFCTLSIVSLGATISESISHAQDSFTRNELEKYISLHGAQYSGERDCLATIFALQDGVSRFSQNNSRSKGGVGMMDVIEFVNSMGVGTDEDYPPAITIISGRACLRIGHPYTPMYDETGGRRLWFNSANVLDQPPDRRYVQNLPIVFPGTVLAIRFFISPGA